MPRIFVIFNPSARGEKSQRLRHLLEAKAGPAVTVAPTQCAGDARRLAAEAVAQGYTAVIAAGGDGTINEVINGLDDSGVPLGILPLGTVNVFAQELGIPRTLAAAWALIEAGTVRTIDLACAEAGGQRRYFAQLAGVGFDAQAVRAASWELKKKIGPLSYLWAGWQVLWQPRVLVEVVADGGANVATGSIVLIGNGRYYGGKLALFPQAKLDDGKLDVCVFEGWSGAAVTRYVHSIWRGTHTRLRDVKYFHAERCECRAAAAGVPFEVDGEDAGEAPVSFSVNPGRLRVIAPPPAND